MLYLAQVQEKGFLGKVGLRLLARQRIENAWIVLTDNDDLLTVDANHLSEGLLLLVELTGDRQVLSIQDATDWVLQLVQDFLVTGITPTFLQRETERAEQWRQSLTLQSQELDRRALELEARREQIQVLEETIKREKKLLESALQKAKSNPSV
jgi:hypothetical protein